jgi:hypothetical protein
MAISWMIANIKRDTHTLVVSSIINPEKTGLYRAFKWSKCRYFVNSTSTKLYNIPQCVDSHPPEGYY